MDLVHGEGSEGALHHSPLAVQRGQEVSECRVDLFTAIGEQQQERARPEMTDEVKQKLETGVVAPMQVFDAEHQGVLLSLAKQEVCQGHKEATFLLCWLKGRSWSHFRQTKSKVRQDFDQLGRNRRK